MLLPKTFILLSRPLNFKPATLKKKKKKKEDKKTKKKKKAVRKVNYRLNT